MYSAIHLLASAIFLSAPTLSQAHRAELPAPTEFKVGDTWEWRQVDHRTKQELEKLTLTVVNAGGLVLFNNGKTSRPMDQWYQDGAYSPSPKPWRVWPLAVGNRWGVDADWVRPDGLAGHTKQEVEVVAYEEVVVPAGRFMAFKIVHRGSFRNSRGTHGEHNETVWYAPDVKVDVKHLREILSNVYVRELTSYKRGPS